MVLYTMFLSLKIASEAVFLHSQEKLLDSFVSEAVD